MKRLLLLALLSAAACAHAQPAPTNRGVLTAEQLAQCPTLGADFARTKVLKLYRAYTGPDGHSRIEEKEIDGKDGIYYEGTVSLRQFGLGDPSNVVIVYGHPNMKIASHPSPYREIFLIVSGSSAIELRDGTRVELKPGSMVLSEDQGSTGRGGTSGPCGYVAIDFQFKDAPAK